MIWTHSTLPASNNWPWRSWIEPFGSLGLRRDMVYLLRRRWCCWRGLVVCSLAIIINSSDLCHYLCKRIIGVLAYSALRIC